MSEKNTTVFLTHGLHGPKAAFPSLTHSARSMDTAVGIAIFAALHCTALNLTQKDHERDLSRSKT